MSSDMTNEKKDGRMKGCFKLVNNVNRNKGSLRFQMIKLKKNTGTR